MVKKKDSYLVYPKWYEVVRDFSDEDLGKLFRVMNEYHIGHRKTQLPSNLDIAFRFFEKQFEIDQQKYEEVCEKNRQNATGGRKGSGGDK